MAERVVRHAARGQFLTVVLISLILAAFTLNARAGDIYTVSGISVDATADTAIAARSQAVAQGQKVALNAVLKRLTNIQDWGLLPEVDEATAQTYVRSYQVANEKSSTTRYLADLTVAFNGAAINALLRQNDLHYAQSPARETVLLPIMETGTGAVLWDETSVWRRAWQAVDTDNSLTPLVLPLGDLEDIASLPISAVENGNKAAIDAFAQRYGTNRLLVASASFASDGSSVKVNYALYEANREVPQRWNQTTLANAGDSQSTLASRAANRNLARMEANWKSRSIITTDERTSLTASVGYETLTGWVAIQNRLNQVPAIDDIDVIAVSTGGALVDISFAGNPESLNLTLLQQGLSLTNVDGEWYLASLR